jgi:hypothetical protein
MEILPTAPISNVTQRASVAIAHAHLLARLPAIGAEDSDDEAPFIFRNKTTTTVPSSKRVARLLHTYNPPGQVKPRPDHNCRPPCFSFGHMSERKILPGRGCAPSPTSRSHAVPPSRNGCRKPAMSPLLSCRFYYAASYDATMCSIFLNLAVK